MTKLPKILVIVGPTASGKTSLGVALAKALNGEIISADSRLLYRGMDIGTAKPTKAERRGVPHHLIDVVDPDQTLTLSEYQALALAAIRDVLKRGKLPIIVGGTGLYVRALVDNLEIPQVPPNAKLRQRLEKMPVGERLAWLESLDPAYAQRAGHNPRFVIRALEVILATGKTMSELQRQGEPLFDALQIGLRPTMKVLEVRIARRTQAMIKAGLLKEARRLNKRYVLAGGAGEGSPKRAQLLVSTFGEEPATGPAGPASLTGIGYRELFPYFRGEISLDEAVRAITLHTRQYAKRQLTWFKRDTRIHWISSPKKALVLAKKWLKSA